MTNMNMEQGWLKGHTYVGEGKGLGLNLPAFRIWRIFVLRGSQSLEDSERGMSLGIMGQ